MIILVVLENVLHERPKRQSFIGPIICDRAVCSLKLDVQRYSSHTVLIRFSYFREEATTASSTFFLRQEKDDQKTILEDKDLEVIGAPIIKYGDSTVLVQHSDTGLWLTYKVCKLILCIFKFFIPLLLFFLKK